MGQRKIHQAAAQCFVLFGGRGARQWLERMGAGANTGRQDSPAIQLHVEGANVVTIAPYPFRREPLAFSIMARRVPKRIYASDGDFQKTLAAAQYSPVKFTMRARRSDAFSRVAGI